MEKRDLSRTYLAVSMDDNTILGFITIGMKCMRVPQENLLSKSVMRQMNIEENSGVAQAYLLGQLVRSKNTSSGFGDRLIDFAMEIFRESKRNVGCRIVRLAVRRFVWVTSKVLAVVSDCSLIRSVSCRTRPCCPKATTEYIPCRVDVPI